MEKSLKSIEYFILVFIYRHCFFSAALTSDLAVMMKYCNFMYYEYIYTKASMRN